MQVNKGIRIVALALSALALVGCMTANTAGPTTQAAPIKRAAFDDGAAAFTHRDIWRVVPGAVSIQGYQSYVLRLSRVPPGLSTSTGYSAARCYLTLDRIQYVGSGKGDQATLIDHLTKAEPTARTGGMRLRQVDAPPPQSELETPGHRFVGEFENNRASPQVQAMLGELGFSRTEFPYFLRCEGPRDLASHFETLANDIAGSFVAPTER